MHATFSYRNMTKLNILCNLSYIQLVLLSSIAPATRNVTQPLSRLWKVHYHFDRNLSSPPPPPRAGCVTSSICKCSKVGSILSFLVAWPRIITHSWSGEGEGMTPSLSLEYLHKVTCKQSCSCFEPELPITFYDDNAKHSHFLGLISWKEG